MSFDGGDVTTSLDKVAPAHLLFIQLYLISLMFALIKNNVSQKNTFTMPVQNFI